PRPPHPQGGLPGSTIGSSSMTGQTTNLSKRPGAVQRSPPEQGDGHEEAPGRVDQGPQSWGFLRILGIAFRMLLGPLGGQGSMPSLPGFAADHDAGWDRHVQSTSRLDDGDHEAAT